MVLAAIAAIAYIAGYLAARWQLTGPVVCVSGTRAGMDVAALLIDDADADEVLVVRVDLANEADYVVKQDATAVTSIRTACGGVDKLADDQTALACFAGTGAVHLAAGTYYFGMTRIDGSRADATLSLQLASGATCDPSDTTLPCEDGTFCRQGAGGANTWPSVYLATRSGIEGRCRGPACRVRPVCRRRPTVTGWSSAWIYRPR